MSRVAFEYSQSPDVVYAFAIDPANIEARAAEQGDKNIRVDRSEANGALTLRTSSVVTQELPGFVAKFFKPTNEVVNTMVWRTEGDVRKGTYDIEVKGTPTKIRGTATIAPKGTGTEYTVDFSVEVKIPLVGKKIEEFVSKLTIQGIEREHAWNRSKLA
jgi:hypothetical protein